MLEFTDRELKLIWLMLDGAAAKGEIANAATSLALSLRARAVSAEVFTGSLPAPRTRPDYGLCTMPWGKHRGEQFKDIAPSYFRYIIGWIEDPHGDRLPRMAGLLSDIKAWLAQAVRPQS
jgi:hypothetical protein